MAYYRVITRDAIDSTLFYIEDFYANGNRCMVGSYKTTQPEYLLDYRSTVFREGFFKYYYDNGSVRSEGQYKSGCEHGTWKQYYTNKKIKEVGKYMLGANKGKRTEYYDNGTVSCISEYTFDFRLAKKQTFDTTGKLESSYTYSNGKVIDSFINSDKKFLDTSHTYEYVEILPQAPYDIYKQLSKKMKYPEDARKQKIKAKIYVRFVIDTEGYIVDVETKYPSGTESMRLEAIRVVSMLKPWKPGTQNGEPVRVFYTLPITFKLSE